MPLICDLHLSVKGSVVGLTCPIWLTNVFVNPVLMFHSRVNSLGVRCQFKLKMDIFAMGAFYRSPQRPVTKSAASDAKTSAGVLPKVNAGIGC